MLKIWLVKIISTVIVVAVLESLAPEGKTRVLLNILFSLALLTVLTEPLQALVKVGNVKDLFSYYA